jgi:hypothetical protein
MHNPMQIDDTTSVTVGLCMDERPGEVDLPDCTAAGGQLVAQDRAGRVLGQ